jgi:mercuric ion transport protein
MQDTMQSASVGGAQRASAREILTAYAGLFSSFATLFCCALPALLVLFGLGVTSTLAFFTAIPGWQDAGEYELWLLLGTGILLAMGFYFSYFSQSSAPGEVCKTQEGSHESVCSTAARWNRRILWLALFLFGLALVVNFWGITWMRAHGYFDR